MAKLKRSRKAEKEREILYGRHSPAGHEYIKSKVAQGKKWKGGKWVDTMAEAGFKKRLKRSVEGEKKPKDKKKPSAYYGGAKQKRKTADEILRRLKGK